MKHVIDDEPEIEALPVFQRYRELSHLTLDELEIKGEQFRQLSFNDLKAKEATCSSKYAELSINKCNFKSLQFIDTMLSSSIFSKSTFDRLIFNVKYDALYVKLNDVIIGLVEFQGRTALPITGIKFNSSKINHMLFEDFQAAMWEFSDCRIDTIELKNVKDLTFFDFKNTTISKVIVDGRVLGREEARNKLHF